MKPVFKKWFGGIAIVVLFSSYLAMASASNENSAQEIADPSSAQTQLDDLQNHTAIQHKHGSAPIYKDTQTISQSNASQVLESQASRDALQAENQANVAGESGSIESLQAETELKATEETQSTPETTEPAAPAPKPKFIPKQSVPKKNAPAAPQHIDQKTDNQQPLEQQIEEWFNQTDDEYGYEEDERYEHHHDDDDEFEEEEGYDD